MVIIGLTCPVPLRDICLFWCCFPSSAGRVWRVYCAVIEQQCGGCASSCQVSLRRGSPAMNPPAILMQQNTVFFKYIWGDDMFLEEFVKKIDSMPPFSHGGGVGSYFRVKSTWIAFVRSLQPWLWVWTGAGIQSWFHYFSYLWMSLLITWTLNVVLMYFHVHDLHCLTGQRKHFSQLHSVQLLD